MLSRLPALFVALLLLGRAASGAEPPPAPPDRLTPAAIAGAGHAARDQLTESVERARNRATRTRALIERAASPLPPDARDAVAGALARWDEAEQTLDMATAAARDASAPQWPEARRLLAQHFGAYAAAVERAVAAARANGADLADAADEWRDDRPPPR